MEKGLKYSGRYIVECFTKDGEFKWKDDTHNLIVNSGINYLISGGWTPSCYIGLLSDTPTIVAGDIMTSHTGWTEVTGYSETVRAIYTKTITANAVTNSASKALFSINATVTVGGIFISTVATKATTTGTLISAAPFATGNKSAISGDLIYVQYDFSATAA